MYKNLSLENIEGEEWRDIVGYEGKYMVSNIGRIKSFTHSFVKILRQPIAREGYCRITLSKKDNQKSCSVHRLVAMAFLPNPLNKPQVNHINSKRDDNRVENLEWCTATENLQHAVKVGFYYSPMKGRKGRLNRLSIPIYQLDLNGRFIKEWDSMSDVQRELGIFATTIAKVCKGKLRQTKGFKWAYKYDMPLV